MPKQPANQSWGTSRQIPAFTGLRAVAAYAVFLHHYNPAPAGTFSHRLLAQGYIGVSVFFVLSGFLIYHRYADTYQSREGWSWRDYLQNRFARVFPLYILLLLLTIGINTAMGRPMRAVELVLNLTLLKGLFDDYKFSGIAQSWSLTADICFYGLAPLLFVTLRRWGALWLTAGLVSVGLLLWTIMGLTNEHGFFDSLSFVFFYTFFGRSFEFVVGMWLARQWRERRIPLFKHATLGGFLIVSCCIVWQAIVQSFTAHQTRLFWSELIVYNYLLPVGIGIFFMGLLREESVIRRFLEHPTMQALGRSSYAFYLIHVGVLAKGLPKIGVTHTGLLFVLLIIMAYVLYVLIEKPSQQRLHA